METCQVPGTMSKENKASNRSKFRRVWDCVAAIPPGHVAAYGQIAELAGWPRGARMVGRALGAAPRSMDLPWHRVLNAQGRISIPKGSRGHAEQIRRLRGEGVTVEVDKVDMQCYQWTPTLDELVWGPAAFGVEISEHQAGSRKGPERD